MITVLHFGGPANDYSVPGFWREYTRKFTSADLTNNSNFFFMPAKFIFLWLYVKMIIMSF